MASISAKTQGEDADIVIDLTKDDFLPLHPDLPIRARLKYAWLVLLGRQVNLFGPFHFEMKGKVGQAFVQVPR